MEPRAGFEPATLALPRRCATELLAFLGWYQWKYATEASDWWGGAEGGLLAEH